MTATDTPPKLYEAQEPVFPRRVSGRFRTLKWWIMGVTLGIYYLTPWIRWDRGPNLPDQAVLVDMANRRFFFFWIEIWPHEFYFVAGLLIMAGLGLFLFTSALGRVWCGYSCPQTVWTDLFVLVERWIEGDRNARIRLWKAPWSARKARLRFTKWTVWMLIAIATGGAWVFYFADAPTLAVDLVTLQAPFVAYASIAILTATTFTFGGFLREQVCIYMCPWPRIQAAMMDEDTLTVGYRDWRGEPRGKGNVRRRNAEKVAAAEASAQAAGPVAGRKYPPTPMPGREGAPAPAEPADLSHGYGDCIDCMACVNVCPMGIDIRDGQQLECITCALCIDACDDVMARIGKPRGLIDYLALSDERRERAGEPPKPVWKHVLRPRTILYTTLWGGVGLALLVALFIRSDVSISVSPVRNPVYVTLSDGSIRNVYEIRLRNQGGEERTFRFHTSADARLELEGTPYEAITIGPDQTFTQRMYLTAAPDSALAEGGVTDLRLWADALGSETRAHTETVFHGRGSE